MFHLLLHTIWLKRMRGNHLQDSPLPLDLQCDSWSTEMACAEPQKCCDCMCIDRPKYQASKERRILLVLCPSGSDSHMNEVSPSYRISSCAHSTLKELLLDGIFRLSTYCQHHRRRDSLLCETCQVCLEFLHASTSGKCSDRHGYWYENFQEPLSQ